jgi:hypothetical protein
VPLHPGCFWHPQIAVWTAARPPFVRSALALLVFSMLAASPIISAPMAGDAMFPASEAVEPAKGDCELNSVRGDIQHVIYIQFSHVRFTRDNPNVPSDLEQMPRLLRFIENNGTLLTNHHTVLPVEPESNALAALTGLYPQRLGSNLASGGTYWTTLSEPSTSNGNSTPNIAEANKHAPAPWVPFTRAGCNVGTVAVAKTTLENTGKDILTVFGANSLEAALGADPTTVSQAAAEFEGIAIHCAVANSICAYGTSDLLPNEPRGYQGFNALFGDKNVEPLISAHARLTDLDGKVISDAKGIPGFPGFSAIAASQSLAYVAAMQEHGVPVTFAYISDPHRSASGTSFGPGEAGYVAQLKATDEAFQKFLARLAADGINQNNTLFVVTADEGGRFNGSAPVPTTCDGINIPCTYTKLSDPLWNHTAIAPEINTTFLGLVGPGIYVKGTEEAIWSDHVDIRPTMLAVLGLKDDYVGQGRVLTELFHPWALPNGVHDSGGPFLQLAHSYKRINAPAAELSLTTVGIAGAAQAGDRVKHNNLERQLVLIGALRDDLSAAMSNLLNDAGFRGRPISDAEARQLVRSANDLVDYVKLVAANGW